MEPLLSLRMSEVVLSEQRGDVLVLTLNRPERLNAWTPQVAAELSAEILRANDASDIGAIVLTGAGRGFCAGADMDDTFGVRLRGEDPGADTARGQGGMPSGLDWVRLCMDSKPLIAAVNGVCVGIGLTQILSFDVIVASEAARFGIGFIRVGLVPELASTRLLAQRMGTGRARMFALSGDLWPAGEALATGLVDKGVDAGSLREAAVALAGRVAAHPAPLRLWTKHLLEVNAVEADLRVVQERESEILRQCWASPEHAEAVAAFKDKRKPVFERRSG